MGRVLGEHPVEGAGGGVDVAAVEGGEHRAEPRGEIDEAGDVGVAQGGERGGVVGEDAPDDGRGIADRGLARRRGR